MNNKWTTYPRPMLVRKEWMCLNGEWKFSLTGLTEPAPASISGDKWEKINVPFCPESSLSGIGRRIPASKRMIYERDLVIPEKWRGRRIMLHFGAIDQTARVFINGIYAGSHEGGYLPFSFDITALIDMDSETPDVLRVEAVDTLDHKYPWGKQKSDNGGMWYTPVSGIWQTVWLEPVAEEHIESLCIDTGLDWVRIRAFGVTRAVVTLDGRKYKLSEDGLLGDENKDESRDDGRVSASVKIDITEPKLWTPETPYLYRFMIETENDKAVSYFALRTLTIEQKGGYSRLCLNGEPYFFNGLLDQGYWQDSIYTPESPSGYESDILAMKSLGFNTLRKHIKIEPQQFYYDCDRLGMAVFQDMVNNSDYSFIRDTAFPTIGIRNIDDSKRNRNPENRRIFLEHMEETVKHLHDHPSICMWTIFNEGWGQFCADEAYDILKAIDDSRFIDSTSGWFHQNKSDVDSYHVYFKPIRLTAGTRPLVLSEFGGYACKLPDHCFNKDKTYGYRKCKNEAALLDDLAKLYNTEVLPMTEKGLSAAVYTQVSDVEDETNGILTYDRDILKFKSYTGTGRIEIIGNHTDHQGGRVMVAPSPHKIRAYVAENHSDHIRVVSEGFEPFEVSITDRADFKKGTTAAIVTGILEGFADLFGPFDGNGNGFDVHIKSEVPVGSGLSSSAAFEILLCRIINDRYYNGKADAVQLAKIAMFAEREFYGKPCGMMDQLAISLGKLAMIDFNGKEPEIELLDFDFDAAGYEIVVVPTESDHAALDDDYASIPEDMFRVARALGVSRLGDLNDGQFRRRLPELEKKVAAGEITELQLNRARHYFDENERVLAAAVALKTGNIERFLQCINQSGLSSENLLRNVVPPSVEENDLSRTIAEYKTKPDTAAVRLIGGGFGGSVLVFRRK